MISFNFRLSKSFHETKGHPITVPAQHLYRLRDEGAVSRVDKPGSKRAVTIVGPDGRRYDGAILYGEAGGSFFYQILMLEDAHSLCAKLRKEETLQVCIATADQVVQVFLLDAGMSAQFGKLPMPTGPQADAKFLEALEKLTTRTSATV